MYVCMYVCMYACMYGTHPFNINIYIHVEFKRVNTDSCTLQSICTYVVIYIYTHTCIYCNLMFHVMECNAVSCSLNVT